MSSKDSEIVSKLDPETPRQTIKHVTTKQAQENIANFQQLAVNKTLDQNNVVQINEVAHLSGNE